MENLNIRLDEDITKQMTVNKNLSQEIIVTNTDKVTIILNDHHKIIKKKIEWINPLGIFITAFGTLLTAQFNKVVFGVDPLLWKAIFVVISLATFGYSVYLIVFAVKYAKRGSIEEFIEKLKNQSRDIKETVAPKIQDKNVIRINSARYGTELKYYDITEKVSEMILANHFVIEASNKFWGDPAKGDGKTLIINCSYGEINKQLSIVENTTIDLSEVFNINLIF
jgi:hypothetical protein